jgi:uncharacterized membrane protein YjdF
MSAKRVTRVLFGSLIALEALGFLGLYPWEPAYSWIGLIVTAAAVWALVEWINPPDAWWPIFFAGLFVDAIADIFLLYTTVDWWDRMMHLMGGVLLALGSWHCLHRAVRFNRISLVWRFLLVLGLVALFGTLYELMEWGVDLLYGYDSRALGSGADTVEDIMLNLVGALVTVSILEYRHRKEKR